MRPPHPADPFRPADWRHRRCEYLVNARKRPSRDRDDDATHAGWRYLRAMRRCHDDSARERVARRYPALHAAHQLRAVDGPLLWGVQAYLMAAVPPPEIDSRFDLPAGTSLTYSEQNYDVLPCLQAHDYLVNVVIKLHSRRLSVKDGGVFVPLFGLMGGRHVVDLLLEYFVGQPNLPDGIGDPDRVRRHLAAHVAITARCLPEGEVSPRAWLALSLLADRVAGDGGEGQAVKVELPGVVPVALTNNA